MKKLFYIILFFSFTAETTIAQNWLWAQRLGNTRSDKAISIKTDSLGYIYFSGYFSNTTTIGTNNVPLTFTANSNSKEAFLAKVDSTGFCYWAKSGGQYFDDRVLGLDVDAQGNSIMVGTYWANNFAMGPITINNSGFGGSDQCFVMKHDKDGNALWGTFVASNSGDDQGTDVASDKMGNSYIVGFMSGNTLNCGGATVTATNTNTAYEQHSYWIAKINFAGVFQWAKCFGNLPFDTAAGKYIERDIAVCVDDSGGVFVTGGFDHTWPFGSTMLTSSGGYDIFVMKYDTAGNFQWATKGGSRKDDWSNGICTDNQGHVYITGEFRDSLIMDTILIKNYDGRDAFVIKIDANTGKPIWGKRAGSENGGERGNEIVADDKCNIYVCGDINDSAKFGDDIIIPPGKLEQAFVAKIEPDGKWKWAITGGGVDDNDRGNAIAQGVNGQLYTCGFFRTPASYGNSNLISTGSSDAFFARVHDSSYFDANKFVLVKPADTSICNGDSVLLPIPKHQFFDYQPTSDVVYDANAKTLNFYPKTKTTYTITGFSKGFCPDYDTLIFTINVQEYAIANFSINPLVASNTNPYFTITNNSTNATSYSWYENNLLFSTSQNLNLKRDSVGDYCFILVASNDEGCNDTATNCCKVIKDEKVVFVNAFTPNGDGNNEEFIPKFFNLDEADIVKYSLQIFNRFGEKIFETNNPKQGWNGKTGNVMNEIGTYFYYAKVETKQGKKESFKGDITLLK